MKRKADLQREYEYACGMVYRFPLGDLQNAFWIGYRDALHTVLDSRRLMLCDRPTPPAPGGGSEEASNEPT